MQAIGPGSGLKFAGFCARRAGLYGVLRFRGNREDCRREEAPALGFLYPSLPAWSGKDPEGAQTIMFYREKKVDCGGYREVDIIPRTDDAEQAVRGARRKRHKVSAPKQKNLNEKNAKRYLVQLGNGNFGPGDLHVSLTYAPEHLPASPKEAEKIITNYLHRIAYRREKLGLPPLKYILVTEYGYAKDDEAQGHPIRIHHHVIMNGGLDRDIVEMMWTSQRINWKKYDQDHSYADTVEKLGWVNADRIQTNENGVEALCKYIMKNPRGKKRWSSSRNLIRPVELPPADHKYGRRKVGRLAKSDDHGREYFERQFPDYSIVEIKPEYYDETGWHIYLKMWKRPKKPRKKGG